jgi:hypothetical protein
MITANAVHNRDLSEQMAAKKKLFDVLAEGLLSQNNRGDWTPFELFIASVQGWEAWLFRLSFPGKPASSIVFTCKWQSVMM